MSKNQQPTTEQKLPLCGKNSSGFTLLEALITVAIVGVVGLILADILARGFKNTNKTQLLGTIKQNGQSALNIIDQTIRNSNAVVCTLATPPTITVVKDNKYTRFVLVSETGSSNGYITQESLAFTNPPEDPDASLAVCSAPPVSPPVIITDTNPTTGVSLKSGGKFSEADGNGGKSAVGIEFSLGPGINSPKGVEGQTDPITFSTTVQLR